MRLLLYYYIQNKLQRKSDILFDKSDSLTSELIKIANNDLNDLNVIAYPEVDNWKNGRKLYLYYRKNPERNLVRNVSYSSTRK